MASYDIALLHGSKYGPIISSLAVFLDIQSIVKAAFRLATTLKQKHRRMSSGSSGNVGEYQLPM